MAATACEDGPTSSQVPGFSIELTTPIPDTALSVLPGGLVISLLGDDLAPISGAPVSFDALAADSAAWLPSLYLTDDTVHFNWSQTSADTTDAEGRARTELRLGCTAGTARVRVRLPSKSIDTTLSFSVVPGEAVRVQLFPSDTAVMTGHSVRLRGGVVDQCGNSRPEPVTVAVDGHVTLLGPGLTFSGTVGLGHVVATSDSGWADTATITVVPPAVLAALKSGTGVVRMNLDGSGYRLVLASSSFSIYGMAWGTQGSILYSRTSGALNGVIMRAAPTGPPTPLLPLELLEQRGPHLSADSNWVFFGRGTGSAEIWRVHPDGQGAGRIGPANNGAVDRWPSPSPDGTRVVFERSQGGPTTLWMTTIATGQTVSLGALCSYPSWSPDGGSIACINNGAHLEIRSPSGALITATAATAALAPPAWTADSRYVVVDRGGLGLVDVTTGVSILLPNTANMTMPALRPYP